MLVIEKERAQASSKATDLDFGWTMADY